MGVFFSKCFFTPYFKHVVVSVLKYKADQLLCVILRGEPSRKLCLTLERWAGELHLEPNPELHCRVCSAKEDLTNPLRYCVVSGSSNCIFIISEADMDSLQPHPPTQALKSLVVLQWHAFHETATAHNLQTHFVEQRHHLNQIFQFFSPRFHRTRLLLL